MDKSGDLPLFGTSIGASGLLKVICYGLGTFDDFLDELLLELLMENSSDS